MKTTARHAACSHGHERAGGRIVDGRAVKRIHRRRIVFVTQSTDQRQVAADAKTVIYEKVVRVASQVLGVVHPRSAGHERKAEQQIAKRIESDLSERRELKQTARLHIAKRVLLHQSNVTAELP